MRVMMMLLKGNNDYRHIANKSSFRQFIFNRSPIMLVQDRKSSVNKNFHFFCGSAGFSSLHSLLSILTHFNFYNVYVFQKSLLSCCEHKQEVRKSESQFILLPPSEQIACDFIRICWERRGIYEQFTKCLYKQIFAHSILGWWHKACRNNRDQMRRLIHR